MRVLIDNCIPRRLAPHIVGHDVLHVLDLGWGSLKDGELLAAADGKFDALVTVDRSLRYQQRIDNRTFGLLVLRVTSNRLQGMLPLVPALIAALNEVQAGEVREVSLHP